MSKQQKKILDKKKNLFLNEKKKTSNRLHALSEYLTISNLSQESESDFLQKHSSLLYSLILDAFSGYPESTLDRKGTSLLATLCSLKNKADIRRISIGILFQFIDQLGENADNSIFEVLEGSICFDTFLDKTESNKVSFRTKPNQTEIEELVVLDSTPFDPNERLMIFQNYLTFITEKTQNHEFWFDIFKNHFFITLYPLISEKVGILESKSDLGFQSKCPDQIQQLISIFLIKWLKDDNLKKILYKSKENMEFALEIIRQTLILPKKFENDVISIIKQLQIWFLDQTGFIIQTPNLQYYLQNCIVHIFNSLIIIIKSNEKSALFPRMQVLLEFLEDISKQKQIYLSKTTWNVFLQNIINLLNYCYLDNYPDLNQIDPKFSSLLINRILNIWIYSQTNSRYYWNNLKQIILKMNDCIDFQIQWKRTILLFIFKFHHIIFNLDEEFLSATEKSIIINFDKDYIPLISETNLNNRTRMKIFRNNLRLPKKKKYEKNLEYRTFEEIFRWNKEHLKFFWKKLFQLFDHIHVIKEPKIHEYTISVYIEILNSLFVIEKLIPESKKKKQIPYLSLFYYKFLPSCYKNEKFSKGRSLAYGGACFLICNHPYPISVQSLIQFYITLIDGFQLREYNIIKSILHFSFDIFGLCFPGINGLLLPYLESIEYLFSKKNDFPISKEMVNQSIIFFSSILNLNDQFQDIYLFNYNLIPNNNDNNKFHSIQKIIEEETIMREQNIVLLMDCKEKDYELYKQLKAQEILRQRNLIKEWTKTGKINDIKKFMIKSPQIRKRIFKILTIILTNSTLENDNDIEIISKNIFDENNGNKLNKTKNENVSNQDIIQQDQINENAINNHSGNEIKKEKQNENENNNKKEMENNRDIKKEKEYEKIIIKKKMNKNKSNYSDETTVLSLWNLYTIMVIELNKEKNNFNCKIISKGFLIFTNYLNFNVEKISVTANTCIQMLMSYSKKINLIDPKILDNLLAMLCSIVTLKIKSLKTRIKNFVSMTSKKKDKKSTSFEIEIPKYLNFCLNSVLYLLVYNQQFLLNEATLPIIFKTILSSYQLVLKLNKIGILDSNKYFYFNNHSNNKNSETQQKNKSKKKIKNNTRIIQNHKTSPKKITNESKLLQNIQKNDNNMNYQSNIQKTVNEKKGKKIKNLINKDNGKGRGKWRGEKKAKGKGKVKTKGKGKDKEKKKSNRFRKGKKQNDNDNSQNEKMKENEEQDEIENEKINEKEKSNEYNSENTIEKEKLMIKNTTNFNNLTSIISILYYFLNQWNNFPNSLGSEIINSIVTELDDFPEGLILQKDNANNKNKNENENDNDQKNKKKVNNYSITKFNSIINKENDFKPINYYDYSLIYSNLDTIFLFQELPKQQNNKRYVRLIIRNPTGKYVWDAEFTNTRNEHEQKGIGKTNRNDKGLKKSDDNDDEDKERVKGNEGGEEKNIKTNTQQKKEKEKEEEEEEEGEKEEEGEEEENGENNSNVNINKEIDNIKENNKSNYFRKNGEIPKYHKSNKIEEHDMLNEMLSYIEENKEIIKSTIDEEKETENDESSVSEKFHSDTLTLQTESEFESETSEDTQKHSPRKSPKIMGKFKIFPKKKKRHKSNLFNSYDLSNENISKKSISLDEEQMLEFQKTVNQSQIKQQELFLDFQLKKKQEQEKKVKSVDINGDDDDDGDDDGDGDGDGDGNLFPIDEKIIPKKKIPITFFHFSRLLLSQLGLLKNDVDNKFLKPLEWNPTIHKFLNELDKKPTRATHKIAVIYVGKGQKNANEILQNTKGSPDFEEFINGLGWKINLKRHLGYRGGITESESNDLYENTPYFADFNNEIIYHVTTRMLNNQEDQSQPNKLKYISNDFIHIIWSEDNVEYNPSIFSSKFNFVHFVIYPLPNGLFKIQILARPEIKLFGPIIDGMVLNKLNLIHLIKKSVKITNTFIYNYFIGNYKHPYQVRAHLINDIINKHTIENNFDDYYSKLLIPNNTEESLNTFNYILTGVDN
ncbi:rho gtpase-activating protein [Anaeramoeba flamelloides]|uniref:Rho gtpase-activating protein n=1 Tax=Anaeramoeba flamelloides TaxID=1746091 RepID=A0AAV7YWQ9_9EUKA|nr:rho gtpase-activating protein [Anaeramoeba flamelloides]